MAFGGSRFGNKSKDKRKENDRNFRPLFKRRKFCRFTAEGIKEVDYKDVESLKKMLSINGKILPRKRTGASAAEQRMITDAIKRARFLGMLPYVGGGAM